MCKDLIHNYDVNCRNTVLNYKSLIDVKKQLFKGKIYKNFL